LGVKTRVVALKLYCAVVIALKLARLVTLNTSPQASAWPSSRSDRFLRHDDGDSGEHGPGFIGDDSANVTCGALRPSR
jgi:hypothetical protein